MEGKIGNLSEGVCADVAILKPIDYRCNFIDANDSSLIGEKLLLPQMTIRQGNIVFRQLNF
jgi:predicted amidohydrolase